MTSGTGLLPLTARDPSSATSPSLSPNGALSEAPLPREDRTSEQAARIAEVKLDSVEGTPCALPGTKTAATESHLQIRTSRPDLLHSLQGEANWDKLSRHQKQMLVDIMERCLAESSELTSQAGGRTVSAAQHPNNSINRIEAQTKAAFVSLLARNVPGKYGVAIPALLQQDADAQAASRTLLDHLHAIATEDSAGIQQPIRSIRSQYLSDLIAEIADPCGTIDQGTDTTCIPTTGQTQLARLRPAEYARIMKELAMTGEARVVVEDPISGERRLSSSPMQEDMLRLAPHIPSHQELGGRSYSEFYFQRACCNMAGAVQGGMYNGAAENLYERLFGVAFKRIDSSSPEAMRAELERVTSKGLSPAYNFASLKWGAAGELHENHIVEITKIQNDMVYFRNPWGQDFQHIPSGVNAQIADAEKSLYRMSLKEFNRLAYYVMVSEDETLGRVAFGITKGCDESIIASSPERAGAIPLTLFFELERRIKREATKRHPDRDNQQP